MMITLTENAKSKIYNLVEEGEIDNPEIKLVSGCAGCSGLSVGITVDEPRSESDHIEKVDDVSVLIEPDSKKYLDGTTIDFEENDFGGNFIVTNEYGSSVCFID